MYAGKLVFAQVMEHLPLHTFRRIVSRYAGERKVKSFSCPGAKAITPEQMELSRVRAENARLRMENRNIEKSDGVLRQGCAVKYAWIDGQRKAYPSAGDVHDAGA